MYAECVGDNWRVKVTLNDRSRRSQRLCLRTVVPEMRRHAGGTIRASAYKMNIFVYAGTAQAAVRAGQMAHQVLAQHGISSSLVQEHWDRAVESWREEALGTQHDEATERRAAHEADQERDRQWSQETGCAAWHVRIQVSSRHDRKALVTRLSTQGRSVVNRRRYLITGADCEDDAVDLARELRSYCGPHTVIRVKRFQPDSRLVLMEIALDGTGKP